MKRKKSSEKLNSNIHGEGWAKALADAEQRLRANKQQQAKIRNAIRIFKAKLKTGEQWPGYKKTGTAA